MKQSKKGKISSVEICWSWQIPALASHVAVVSDVLAATTNIVRILSQGARSLRLVDEQSVARVCSKIPGALVAGESTTLPKEFFAVSNHPLDIFKYDFHRRDVIYMSNNGTRVISRVLERGAQQVAAAAFVNIGNVAVWCRKQTASQVIGIASGERSYEDMRAPEDHLCLEVLRKLVTGEAVDWKATLGSVRRSMLEYYSKGFDSYDLEYVLAHDTISLVPVFTRQSDGTIGAQTQ